MRRGTRWLLLVAIAAILSGIGFTYRAQKKIIGSQAIPAPAPLPEDLHSAAQFWCWTETDAKNRNRVTADICAASLNEVKDSSRLDLKDVTLKLPNKTGDAYDLIKSATASFYKADHRLQADGAVSITLNVPMTGQPKHALVTVESSAVTFNTDTGRAETDQPSTFTFENGTGKATGAFYDPQEHELRMKSAVEVHHTAGTPNTKPMIIEAGSLVYHEGGSDVQLSPWGRLTRDNTVVEGDDPHIQLVNQHLHNVHAFHGHGTDSYPNRKLQYAADELWMEFDDKGEVQKITGQGHANLVSTSDSSETTVTAQRVELDFQVQGNESLLTKVLANGEGVVTSKPLPAAGRDPGETHVLRSDNLEMQMRPGGRDIDTVLAHGRGTLEFVPNIPAQRHRLLTADNLVIRYGAANRIDNFHASNARTVTDPNAEESRRKRAPSNTSSQELVARFDPKTSRLASLEQTGDFSYAEGDRQARAAKATLDSDQNVIVLDGYARMWDTTGSTSADRIRMDQRTGDFRADGNVNSSRMPEADAKKNSQMLSGDQPLQAQARRMVSTNRNRTIHYEGNVLMWQGANRITAETIDLDREKRTLVANGSVVSNLWEQPKDDAQKKNAPAVLTVVRAPHLVYTDDTRLAVYSGGADLVRSNTHVTGKELRAFMSESGADSRLDKAFADGSVVIVQKAPDRTRTGTAEHSEYYTGDQRVVLTGGRPKFTDTLGNSLEGAKLTYWANDDRLQSDAPDNQPVESRMLRRRK